MGSIKTEELVVKIRFITDVLGTAPPQKILEQDFFKLRETMAKMEAEKRSAETGGLSVEAHTEEDYQVPEKADEYKITYFRRDDSGAIYMPNFMLKGFFKSAAQALQDQISLSAFKARVDRYVFVFPNKLYLYKGKKLIKDPDDIYIRSLRAMTPRGERVSLIASERVKATEQDPVEIEAKILLIKNKSLKLSMLKTMLDYGYYCGMGQFRNGGYGRFTWELVSQVELPDDEDEGVKRKRIRVRKK